jgi:CHAT domain-containing protein
MKLKYYHFLILLISLFLLCIPYWQTAQNRSKNDNYAQRIAALDSLTIYYCDKNLDSVVYYTRQLQELYSTVKDYENVLTVAYKTATCAYYQQHYEIMYDFLKAAEDTIKLYSIKPTVGTLAQGKQTWGVYYYTKGDYENAIQCTNDALTLQETDTSLATDLYGVYNNLGMLSYKNGDNKQAVDYFKNAEKIVLKSNKKELDYRLATLYNNIGLAFDKENVTKLAIDYFKKAITISNTSQNKIIPEIIGLKGGVYNNLALAYLDNSDYQSALKILTEALQNADNERWQWELYNSLGFLYQKQKQYKLAHKYFQQALLLRKKRFGNNHLQVGITYQHIGKNYHLEQQYAVALQYYQKALSTCIVGYKDSLNIFAQPNLEHILSEKVLLHGLQRKAEAFLGWYEVTKQDKYLIQAFEHYAIALKLLEQTRREYKSEESKQFLMKEFIGMYEKSIHTALQLYTKTKKNTYLEQAFQITEKSKAVTLLEQIQDVKAKKFANIPDSLLQKERSIKIDLAFYEKKLYTAQQSNDSTNILFYESIVFKQKENYNKFRQTLEKQYPKYFNLKYNNNVPPFVQIQNKLKNNEVLIEYFMGDSTIYAFGIFKNKIKWSSQPITANFYKEVQQFRQLLTDFELYQKSPDSTIANYQQLGHTFYQTLFKTFDLPTVNYITIVPDGILGYIPFETLVKTKQKNATFKNMAYLIKDKTIHYAYSVTILKDSNTKHHPTKGYGGFAAHYKGKTNSKTRLAFRNEPTPLPNAAKEITTVAKITKGEAHLNKTATEAYFKTVAHQYQILHFAMHGLFNDKSPLFSHLLFTQTSNTKEDNQLNALEIYNLNLNADLSILSACNTGIGTIRKGEGVLSLARAFAYAGCPSVVMSLWNVPDAATQDLMISFIEHIKAHQPQHEALRTAKLAYLKQQDALFAHPMFWAGFVHTGDTSEISLMTSANRLYYVITVVFSLFIIIYLVYTHKKRE